MQRRLSKTLWLAIPGLWLACEHERSLGSDPSETGGTGSGGSAGNAGHSEGGSNVPASGRGGSAGKAGNAGSPGKSGASGSGGSRPEGGHAGEDDVVTAGRGGDCSVEPSPPFDDSRCETPTFTMGDSTCSTEQTRAALACGEPGSQFDPACCYRARCDHDSECAAGARCMPRVIQAVPDYGVFGSLVESCEPSCLGCQCAITDNVDQNSYCIAAEEDPERFFCNTAGVACDELIDWRLAILDVVDWLEAQEAQEPQEPYELSAESRLSSCVGLIEHTLIGKCNGECGTEPVEPIDLSHCAASPFLGSASCSEEQLRPILGCGTPGSANGPDCCRRVECGSDQDCDGGGTCIPATLGVPGRLAQRGRIVECDAICDRCSCSGTADAGPSFSAFCIGADEETARFDCPVSDAPCDALAQWRDGLPEYRDAMSGSLRDRVQSCIDSVATEMAGRCEDP